VFSPRRLRNSIFPVIIAAAALTMSSAIAVADSTDDAYLAQLHKLGVTWPAGEDSVAVALGHAICVDRNNGFTPDQIATDVHNQLNGKGFSYQDATAIVSAAESNYCPG
jgi:hypothetical protein